MMKLMLKQDKEEIQFQGNDCYQVQKKIIKSVCTQFNPLWTPETFISVIGMTKLFSDRDSLPGVVSSLDFLSHKATHGLSTRSFDSGESGKT